jgi:triosephosphate isomerase
MRTPLVAGNWKLNGTRDSNRQLLQGVLASASAPLGAEIMVCPPYVYLEEVARLVSASGILLGAQDLSVETTGAFTGEVSGAMLLDVGCTHVIIGHSERRAGFGDTDSVVAAKYMAAHDQGLQPIICVGESLEDRESGVTMDVIDRQIGAILDTGRISALASSVIAYEPVWAIGTGRTASPDQAQEVHAHIRGTVAAADAKIAGGLRILYGGSVKGANAAELFSMDDIDGGLIGGASLDVAEFAAIYNAAAGTSDL